MKKIFLSILILTSMASTRSNAEAPAKIEVQNESSFKLDANSRNPFWPIGWKPAPKLSGGKEGDRGGDIPLSAFIVSSITMDVNGHFAIINGKTMKEGQQFGLRLGSETYQIAIKQIDDGRVVLTRHGQDLVVPLRRK